ncbi:hypothetical protein E2562_021106, partial [Oryza meyeriana var. granulata]
QEAGCGMDREEEVGGDTDMNEVGGCHVEADDREEEATGDMVLIDPTNGAAECVSTSYLGQRENADKLTVK